MNIQPSLDSTAENTVSKALDQIGEISTLPEITLKIIETVEDPRSTARDLHEIVMHDLALSARILRVVNSAFYGLPGQVASIERAIVMLGLNAVKNIAIAASLNRVFRAGRISKRYSARDLWTHSVAVGAAAKLLVEAINIPLPDEAFVGGLIHDIGLVVMLQSNAPAMQELVRAVETAEEETPSRAAHLFASLEAKLFGASHEVYGAGLARRWKFPRSFQYVTGYHHNPGTLAPENRLLTLVVNAADRLCCERGIGIVLPVDSGQIDPQVLDELRLGETQLTKVRDALPAQLEQAIDLLD
ncbi:MAG: HDOD domain-containing protein [Phycisphaerae bacterium]|nr:HDOD domain-containing protein [Phycisphaerae bacterium]